MLSTLVRVFAAAGLILLQSMILHKGYTDVSALAQKHSGGEFWRALARYFITNIGGGGGGPGGGGNPDR
jgi:hypothetical protein